MRANEITYGIELEVTIPNAFAPVTGGYHAGRQVIGLPIGWNAQRDGSIQAKLGHTGVEIVSPILKGADGLAQIKLVCEWLNTVGATVNESTGFHVHVGFDRTNQKALKRLIGMVSNHEKAIYASTGTKSRENNRYCKSVRQSRESARIHTDGLPGYADRYHVLNVANLASNARPTVEFRAFAGTTNCSKVLGYVRMCVGLVERSINETCGRKFFATPQTMTGSAAVRKLFAFLGWTGTEPKAVWGQLEVDGVPSMTESTSELLRLAKKYDLAR